MDKNIVDENKAIQEGLEKFLDQEMDAGNLVKPGIARSYKPSVESSYGDPVKTEFARESKPLKTEFARESKSQKTEISSREIAQNIDEKSKRKTSQTASKRNADMTSEPYVSKGEMQQGERSASYPPKPRQKRSGKNDMGTKNQKNNRNAKKSPGKKAGNGKQKKKMSKAKKVLIIIILILVAVFLWWYFMVGRVYNKMNYEKNQELSSGALKEDGVMNILLIGNDSRENGEDGRSDAMILVSISNKTKTIHMTSLLRDMYVEIEGHDGNRLNAAYAYGGAALLCDTIERNLGIEVNRYALVNFQAFASLVDATGGVDLDVTNEEVQWINAYLNEYNELEGRDITTDYLDTSLSGNIHLNGPQALAYSRNRYIGTDFGRTERQRKVLSAVMKKLPLTLATNSGELIDGLFPNLTTNLTRLECYELSLNATKLLSYDVVQSVVPAEGTYSNATIRQMAVLQVDYDANKAILQRDIYGVGAEDGQ